MSHRYSPEQILAMGLQPIQRSALCRHACRIVDTLCKAGHEAYLVGGCVRDLLMGLVPKDFDVATDARPEQIQALFRRSRQVGRRFPIVHLYSGRDFIEVSTFRGQGEHADQRRHESGRVVHDALYGSHQEDVWRRDFSINALAYNPVDEQVLDHTGGLPDLAAGRLRIIGEPAERFVEDPVRMLRAVRFTAKLGLEMDENIQQAIRDHVGLLATVSSYRLFDEVQKMFLSDHALATFQGMRAYGLFAVLFPEVDAVLTPQTEAGGVFVQALKNTEQRMQQGQPVMPGFLFAALLWQPFYQRLVDTDATHFPESCDPVTLHQAADDVFAAQLQRVSMTRRCTTAAREIWALQPRFYRTQGKRPKRLMQHPRFRAAYDFLVLRHRGGEALQTSLDFWEQRYQEHKSVARPHRRSSKTG